LRKSTTSTSEHDLIVVGGGVGGSALAATMAGAGRDVLVLEGSVVFEDHVRGEWMAPWGVAEAKRLGLYDVLVAAGGHHLRRHVTYDETLDPAEARKASQPLDAFAPDVPGPLCLGHPSHCQALFDEAARRGATMVRGVEIDAIFAGDAPRVIYTVEGERREARARLLIGADGRNSIVRDACNIQLHADFPHHMFGGLLVKGVEGWDESEQAIGTEDDFGFLAFPQGGGMVRVFGTFSLHDRARFAGPDGPRRFLDSLRMTCSPEVARIADGEPAGPLRAYVNSDTWTDEPYAPGAVLIGDAAGWNDPLIGLGLSVTYRDVRIVSDLLAGSGDWGPDLFAPYAEERRERMRRLRFVARLTASLDAEFGAKGRARRRSYFERAAVDPTLGARGVAIMAGPEAAPPETFTAAHRARVLGETEEV
jgi:2-polyprenyl-6-methoxyphenol hydroxylase-like FAD-dependent oxidoreductase